MARGGTRQGIWIHETLRETLRSESGGRGSGDMKNFANLFVAWMVVWAVFFGYEVSIARRLGRLRDEIARLRDQIGHP